MDNSQEERPKILVVDDLVENRTLLSKLLEPRGFDVTTASGGKEALESVAKQRPDAILLDLMMPEMTGFEVCEILKQDPETHHIPIIIITGMEEREANVKALEMGADDYIRKPFDSLLLQARIQSSVKSKRLRDKLRDYRHQLENHNKRLEDAVLERTAQLVRAQQVTVFGLAKLAESRDTETGEHLERMRSYAREIAAELFGRIEDPQLDENFPQRIFQSSPLHDIGKVGIPDQILLKPGKLTEEEFDIMRMHSRIGGETLKAADIEAGENSFLAMGRDIAYYHHEKWDGSGYPFGLAGHDIPLAARIVAVADVYDALTSKRPYKKAFPHKRSVEIVMEGAGSHFDANAVEAFLAKESRIVEIRAKFDDSGRFSPMEEVMQRLGRTTDSAG